MKGTTFSRRTFCAATLAMATTSYAQVSNLGDGINKADRKSVV